jgi:hypothetical protein
MVLPMTPTRPSVFVNFEKRIPHEAPVRSTTRARVELLDHRVVRLIRSNHGFPQDETLVGVLSAWVGTERFPFS